MVTTPTGLRRAYRNPLRVVSLAVFLVGATLFIDRLVDVPSESQLVAKTVRLSESRLIRASGDGPAIYFHSDSQPESFLLGPFETMDRAFMTYNSMPLASNITVVYYPEQPDRIRTGEKTTFTAYSVQVNGRETFSYPGLPLGWTSRDVRAVLVGVFLVTIASVV